ncbi:two-component regulator propeller domain-containing protein [Cytophagaceae bacterium YF14B1]|uniref:histidine kinase n=1 Tax=Xanthocytophaga flava TaxID=3048013 RepID=A0AAE3UB98_9BACT|nr:two-component regulator propeller domain-containing protein [Xanthocytophaga flavus]MDJ1485567.1 two-component regulator propeller domain-containing protein [Xanthocytophaga flavus]
MAQKQGDAFFRLTTNQGLSHNRVNAILKDPDGFLWFGTYSGLNRYDGYSFKKYYKQPNDTFSLQSNSILYLFNLPYGNIWIVNDQGSCIYDPDLDRISRDYRSYLISLGLPGTNVSKIVKGQSDRYWFIYPGLGLYMYSAKDRKVIRFKHRPALAQQSQAANVSQIADVLETNQGQLWLVYANGYIQKYDIRSDRIVYSSDALEKITSDRLPDSFIEDTQGNLWIWSFNNGVFLFNPAKGSVRHLTESSPSPRLASNKVTHIIEDSQGVIWVATDQGGITLIDKNNGFATRNITHSPKKPEGLSQNSINTLYKDESGIIWIGTYKQGVDYLNDRIVRFLKYYHSESDPNSLPFEDINAFAEDSTGNVWIGTNGGGLIHFDRRNNRFRQYMHDPSNKNSLSSNVIVSLHIDRQQVLWIGTYFGGLNRFDGKTFTRYRNNPKDPTSLTSDNVWSICQDSDGRLWVGTLAGLDRLDQKSNTFIHNSFVNDFSRSFFSSVITTIRQDSKGNVWFGTNGGLIVLDKTRKARYYNQQSSPLKDNTINCLLEDSKGAIWVGTRAGLYLYDPAQDCFQEFTSLDGLPDNMITNILEDSNGIYWISTSNGLCSAKMTKNQQGLVTLSATRYGSINNLQSMEFTNTACLKTRSGELFFGGPAGFNVIAPEKISRTTTLPGIIFTNLQIINKPISPGERFNKRVVLEKALSRLPKINLKYEENIFSLDFSLIDYTQDSNIAFAYMLEGFKSEWIYINSGQRKLTFTNLDAGEYTLKIRILSNARDLAGKDLASSKSPSGIDATAASLKISIAPPLWRSTFALILYGVLSVGLAYFIRRMTIAQIRMRFEVQNQRKQTERAYALEQLKTKLFTNISHEFRTPLSLILAPLEKILKQSQDPELNWQLNLMQRNANRLLSLVNQLLDFRKMEAQQMRLNPSVGDIVGFCRDIHQLFTDIAEAKKIDFTFASTIQKLEIYFDTDKMEKILFNLLSNAFKYTFDRGRISVHLDYEQTQATEATAGKEGMVIIEVTDTGIGIAEPNHEKIFESFFQNDNPDNVFKQGTGLGLAITREFVKLHKGSITVKSELNKGSCFTVSIPAIRIGPTGIPSADADSPGTVLIEADLTNAYPSPVKPSGNGGKSMNAEKKTLLIVEDNEDLRFYLKENLKEHYHIHQASNGSEGWQKIKRLLPDLIVSDIMMPLIDGIELARKVRSEATTAHIPIIMLTAVGNEQKQLEGYQVGVTDYISKPFTFEILASRINNLMINQSVIHKKLDLTLGETTLDSLDEKFLRRVIDIVEQQIGNPDFSVEQLSIEMNMNRVTFYRKILPLTGKTPIEFIRLIRLKRAAQLLEKSGLTIAEVAYQVGFNDARTFTRSFKEEFKVLPSQYLANRKRKQ